MISVLLFILLVFIWCIPSGPKCPKCKSYLTHEFNIKAINKKTKTEHVLQAKMCFMCNNKWDMMKDGKKVNKFNDDVVEETTDE